MPGWNIGVDLGTSKLTAYVQGKGICCSQANAVCFDRKTREVVALGNDAAAMLERTPDAFVVEQPMQNGAISDFSVMRLLLERVLNDICKDSMFRPNLIVTTPSGMTGLEKRTLLDVACACGAAKVSLLDHAIASALGAGVSIEHPHGVMVLDVGAGTADAALMTMGTVAYAASWRIAGNAMDELICRHLHKTRYFEIGVHTARRLKHQIGCAVPREEELELFVGGKDYRTQMPVTQPVTSNEICAALTDWVEQLAHEVLNVLDQAPPELFSDVCEEGILLCGGVSHLSGLDRALEERLKIKVNVAADGEHCAAKGAGLSLPYMKTLEDHGLLFRLKERKVTVDFA